MLVFDRDGGQLVQVPSFAIFAGISGEVEREGVVGRAEVNSPQEQFPDCVEGRLLRFAPKKFGVAATKDVRHWLGQHGVILDEAAGDDEKSQNSAELGDVGWRDQVLQGVEVLVGKADAVLVHDEAEKLGGGVSNAGLSGVEGDAIVDADGEEFLEVVAELVEVVRKP